jgi:hypothetical protein
VKRRARGRLNERKSDEPPPIPRLRQDQGADYEPSGLRRDRLALKPRCLTLAVGQDHGHPRVDLRSHAGGVGGQRLRGLLSREGPGGSLDSGPAEGVTRRRRSGRVVP